MFRVALFIIGSIWKHCKCPSLEEIGGGIVHSVEYSTVTRIDEHHSMDGSLTVMLHK